MPTGRCPLAGYDGAAWTYLSGRDALNSVRQETDAEGRVLVARSFDPYGVPLSGDGGEPFGYTGEYRDEASGLVFLRARYLQVADGRFVTRDAWPGEAGQPMTFNPWLYGAANPLRWMDPSGHRAECGAYGGECGNTDGLWGQYQSGTYREYPGPAVSAEEVSRNLGYVLQAELIVYSLPLAAPRMLEGAVCLGRAAAPYVVTTVSAVSQWAAANPEKASTVEGWITGAFGCATGAGSCRPSDIAISGFINQAYYTGQPLEEDPPASTPVGRSGKPLIVDPGTNSRTTIQGREYSGHALDRMQQRGIPPSAVENEIQPGNKVASNNPGTEVYYDSVNNLTVVVNADMGRVITTHQGKP